MHENRNRRDEGRDLRNKEHWSSLKIIPLNDGTSFIYDGNKQVCHPTKNSGNQLSNVARVWFDDVPLKKKARRKKWIRQQKKMYTTNVYALTNQLLLTANPHLWYSERWNKTLVMWSIHESGVRTENLVSASNTKFYLWETVLCQQRIR